MKVFTNIAVSLRCRAALPQEKLAKQELMKNFMFGTDDRNSAE